MSGVGRGLLLVCGVIVCVVGVVVDICVVAVVAVACVAAHGGCVVAYVV